eukprot:Em0015g1059a
MQQATFAAECRPDVVTAIVTGYEKRKCPSKHYVFVVTVVWSNDDRFEIYRRYNDFFSLHEVLTSTYPESMKTIPTLPKRIIFGRSNVAKVAEARLDAINKYCQAIMNMDPSIAQGNHVLSFFSSHIGDKRLPKIDPQRLLSLHPQIIPSGSLFEEHYVMEDFTAQDKTELSVKLGDRITVMAKDPSGWCMCQKDSSSGWLPLSYLRRGSFIREEDVLGFLCNDRDAGQEVEVEGETYKAIATYEAQGPGQVSFKTGDVITVLDKMEDGWWFVSKEEIEGWAPSSYLETLSGVDEQDSISNQASEQLTYIATEEYTAENEDELTFPRNAVITVTQRLLDGWWQATYNGHTGLVPSSHLVPFGEQPDIIQLSQEKWIPRQQYSQPPRKKKLSTILPAITIEQPVSSSSNDTVMRKLRNRPRPKSFSAFPEVDHKMISEAPKRKTYLSRPASPNSTPVHHTLSPSLGIPPQRGPQSVAEQRRMEPTAAESNSCSQQLAEMMVRFILASNNPDLRAALKKAIESDPNVAESL